MHLSFTTVEEREGGEAECWKPCLAGGVCGIAVYLQEIETTARSGSCLETKLISRCGVYCGACYIYRAFNDGGKMLDAIAQQVGVSKKEIRCNGCLGPEEDLWRNCKKCQIRACLKEKGFGFCYECPDFEDSSCVGYEKLREGCSRRREDTREALLRIKAGDADGWLKEQDLKWRCSACGSCVWWEQETCFQCGQPIGRC